MVYKDELVKNRSEVNKSLLHHSSEEAEDNYKKSGGCTVSAQKIQIPFLS
jgi:hypothetical protein